jgi:alpha-tubulin suppressor-like RCC1 family protein
MFIKNGSFKKYTHIISYVPSTIFSQPTGGTKNVGSDYTFTISARGSKPLTYQWYKNGSIISGENTNELNLTNLQLTDDANYYCKVSNNGYSIDSNTAKLNVLVSISFATQPSSVSANPNSNVSFTASAVGTPPITYKWYKNSLIYPGTAETIFINNVQKPQEGTYFAVVSNLLTSITSNSVTLTVNDGIIIKDQPDNTSLNVGENLTLSLSCVGTFPISAQWRKNRTNYGSLSVTNTGDVELEISNVQYSDEGNYDCVLSNVVGLVTSNEAIFYINKPPTFVLNPVDGFGYNGSSFTFTSNATGTNPISYQWIKEDSGIITEATLKNYTLDNLIFANSGRYACVASNLYGTVTSTFASLSVKNAEVLVFANKIAAGNNHSFFIGTDGSVSACGSNGNGQLGDGTTTNRSTPVKLNLPPVSYVAAGYRYSLFLGTDGSVSACGSNGNGQLGDGTTISKSTPVLINLPPVSYIAAGTEHSLFLGTDGTVSACGKNDLGQLGDGTKTDRPTPFKLNLPAVSYVAAGNAHSLFLGTDGAVSACGRNTVGQLGDGTLINRFTPILINLPPVSYIAVGDNHSLFLGTDGTLSACGNNAFGQLGNGTINNRFSTPILINLPPVSYIDAGANHSFFLGTDGTLSACGNNFNGQLGNGTINNRFSTPILINLPPVSYIAVGDNHSFFLGTDGTLSACGHNGSGLGNGTLNGLTPTPVLIDLPLLI